MRKLMLFPLELALMLLVSQSQDMTALSKETKNEQVQMRHIHPKEIDSVLNNPFMGLVPDLEYGNFPLPHSMVYQVLTWRELEPVKGKYAFEAMEKKYKFHEWQQRGVKIIFRVVLDYSSGKVHKDLPDWLYQEIKGDGIWYNSEVGKGFSPNYYNKTLLHYHKQLIQALGKKYNQDPRVAFIALGSLGHWGEWHTYSGKDLHIPFPSISVSNQYVQHYLEAFPDKKLLMRRPYPIVQEQQMGLYNDMFGSIRSTNDFIHWFENGYDSVLANAKIPPMPLFWLHGPSGGEFGYAGQNGYYYTDDNIETTLQMARRSHLSWVGPSSGIESLTQEEQHNLKHFLNTIGYRFVVRTVAYPDTWTAGTKVPVSLEIENKGVAPFYYPWPVELSLIDENGKVAAQMITKQDIRKWIPGVNKIQEQVAIPADLPSGKYSVGLAILDPAKKQPGLDLANEGRRSDGRYTLGDIIIRK